jgi:hypothetical protein
MAVTVACSSRTLRLSDRGPGSPPDLDAEAAAFALARIIRGGLDSDTSGVWKVAGVGLRWT